MQLENIVIIRKNNLAIVTINNPPANTWNWSTMKDFEKALDAVENDKEVRVLIITGAGEKYFSAGFDVRDAGNSNHISPKARELWRRIDRFSRPTIAAINGYALGGGLELALCCHFRIMADTSTALLGLTELNLGIIPGWGGTQRLTPIVGKAKALDMILFSKKLNAKEAFNAGLVNQLSSQKNLMKDALNFAEVLAKRPPIAVSCVLRSMATGVYEGIEAGLLVEEKGSEIVKQTEDCKEGFRAFIEKREPVFKGK